MQKKNLRLHNSYQAHRGGSLTPSQTGPGLFIHTSGIFHESLWIIQSEVMVQGERQN